MSTIRDISLAPLGHKRIEWVKDFMPVLSTLRERFVREQPFRGLRISVCVHLEAKTAYLALVLRDGFRDRKQSAFNKGRHLCRTCRGRHGCSCIFRRN